jgi:hypothetical protein
MFEEDIKFFCGHAFDSVTPGLEGVEPCGNIGTVFLSDPAHIGWSNWYCQSCSEKLGWAERV